MDSISVSTGNWALECAPEIYAKQIMLSKNYKLFLSKYNYYTLMFELSIDMSATYFAL